MRLKNLLSSISAVSIAALSLVGCQDYDNGFTESQLKFIQGFKDVFGEIDHSNDWNLAERGSVTVTTSKPSRIKIYANTFGTYKIVGDYENINDTQTLTFDMVEGTTDILVSDGQTAQKVKVGDVVVFSGTRYVYTGAESETNADGSSIVSVGDENSWEFFDYDTYVDIITNKSTGHLPEGIDNLGNVTQNFTYISDGPFTIYPLYMFTTSCHILGVYWKETSKSGEEILHSQPVYRNRGMYQDTDEWVRVSGNIQHQDGYSWSGYKAKPITINLPVGTPFGFYLKVYNDQPDTNQDKNKLSHVVYSSGTRNTSQYGRPLEDDDFVPESDFTPWVKNRILEQNQTVWAGTFTTTVINSKDDEEEVVYLAFEDWGELDIFDLNDLVFIMKGDNLPIIIDEDPTYWVLSWEDLGGFFDLDYNDVVIKVGHIAGKSDLEVVPLAAGGTLASFLYFNDGIKDGDKCLGEIHSYFGQKEERTSGTYTPVNVNIDKGEPEIEANITDTPAADIVMVSPTWSLSTFTPTTHLTNRTELEASKNTMGGFYIKVIPEGEAGTPENADKLSNKQKIQNRPIDTAENVPYVICTPYNWRRIDNGQVCRGTYRWPREHVPMLPLTEDANNDDVAYTGYGDISRAFEAWVGGRQFENGKYLQTSIYWYRYPNVEKTVGDTTPTSSGGGSSSGGVGGETGGGDPTEPGDPEEDEGKKMYLEIGKDNDWGAIFGSGNLLTESIDLSESEHTFQNGNYIRISVWDYDYMGSRGRKNLTVEYDYDNDGDADETFDNDTQFSIQVKGEPGTQTITVIGGEEEGYKAYSIKITFKVVSSGSGNGDDTYTPPLNATCKIVASDGTALTVYYNTETYSDELRVLDYDGSTNQLWKFQNWNCPSGFFIIQSKNGDGGYLTLSNNGTDAEFKWGNVDDNNTFKFEDAGNGMFYISVKSLDDKDNKYLSKDNDTNKVYLNRLKANATKWKIELKED